LAKQVRFDLVLTGPLQRARRTCGLVGLDRQPDVEPNLAEWEYGDYEGNPSSDIRQGRPDWSVFRDGCPHSEMPAQVRDRADLADRAPAHDERERRPLLTRRIGPAPAARWIGLPLVEAQHFTIGTASLGILGYNPAHPQVRVIALWNSTPTLLAVSV
jgi:broad specificity phosphatase PhoE